MLGLTLSASTFIGMSLFGDYHDAEAFESACAAKEGIVIIEKKTARMYCIKPDGILLAQ